MRDSQENDAFLPVIDLSDAGCGLDDSADGCPGIAVADWFYFGYCQAVRVGFVFPAEDVTGDDGVFPAAVGAAGVIDVRFSQDIEDVPAIERYFAFL